jgi:hypothetical protein
LLTQGYLIFFSLRAVVVVEWEMLTVTAVKPSTEMVVVAEQEALW